MRELYDTICFTLFIDNLDYFKEISLEGEGSILSKPICNNQYIAKIITDPIKLGDAFRKSGFATSIGAPSIELFYNTRVAAKDYISNISIFSDSEIIRKSEIVSLKVKDDKLEEILCLYKYVLDENGVLKIMPASTMKQLCLKDLYSRQYV